MELDDLKQHWQQTLEPATTKMDIMKMIQHKSYGPVAALKKEFRKQMVMMALLPLFLLITAADDPTKALTSVLFWSYVVFCIGVVAFAYRNYRIADKMQDMNGAVRANLEQQITLLEKRLQWKIVGVRVALLFFILLLEVTPYFQHYRMLDKWHALAPAVRFGAYGALLLFQYFTNRVLLKRKFGNHLSYLKELVAEM
jgi:hypothetical protein